MKPSEIITERHIYEETLKFQKELLDKIDKALDSIHESMKHVDPFGNMVYNEGLSSRYISLVNYKRQIAVFKKFKEMDIDGVVKILEDIGSYFC